MSEDELLNLSNELLDKEELDIEAHAKKGTDEPVEEKDPEVEGHLLDNDLLDL